MRELYRLAAEQDVQLRRLTSSRDSLEDIFLRAMEEGGEPRGRSMTAATGPTPGRASAERGACARSCALRARRSLPIAPRARPAGSRLALVPLGFGGFVYLANNLDVLTRGRLQDRTPTCRWSAKSRSSSAFLAWQSGFAFLLAAFVGAGAGLARPRNSALPLYLARPLSRGRVRARASSRRCWCLLSAVTWVPGLLLFALQASLAESRLARGQPAGALGDLRRLVGLDPAPLAARARALGLDPLAAGGDRHAVRRSS